MAEVTFEYTLTFDEHLPNNMAEGYLKHWTLEDEFTAVYNCYVQEVDVKYSNAADPQSHHYCLYFDLSESPDAAGIYYVYYGMSGTFIPHNNKAHSLQLMIRPEVFHHYFSASNDNAQNIDMLKTILQPGNFQGAIPMTLKMILALMKLPRLAGQTPVELYKVRGCVYEVLSLFLNELINPSPAFSNRALTGICRMIEVNDGIAADMDQEMPSLEEAARRSCMCLTKFKKLFRLTYKTTYHKYHQRLRLLKAREMFQAADMNITTIVHDLGYKNAGHFARLFKECFNISPKEYQRQFEGLL
ncbi:AraC family transcriptional regulator [Chitinophaga sedimenti]|uniref:helix-turn-helix domain-containing protein n=1 Tax=Chitinophaga sedimenti TaxID=2033606 RepID=UPI002004EB42|nr:AraC family transcriptional regulator [Chitinophaga sedimenti]MCK7554259.1 AraC family transcriptional regulator [Chitinophaga sedimenti]